MAFNLSLERFHADAKEFTIVSDKLWDGWKFIENEDRILSYIKKECYINPNNEFAPLKAEFIVFYSLSYGVPQFSFNVWNSSGVLLTIEELIRISFIKVPSQTDEKLYSVITQQEHPVLFRPYFIVHPCKTAELLTCFIERSSNIIVTFLGMIEAVIKLDLSMEYGKPCASASTI